MPKTRPASGSDDHLTRRQRREQLTAVQWLRRNAEDRVWLQAAASANGLSPTAYLVQMEERLVAAFGRRRFTFAECRAALATLTEQDAAARGRSADDLRAEAVAWGSDALDPPPPVSCGAHAAPSPVATASIASRPRPLWWRGRLS